MSSIKDTAHLSPQLDAITPTWVIMCKRLSLSLVRVCDRGAHIEPERERARDRESKKRRLPLDPRQAGNFPTRWFVRWRCNGAEAH